MKRAATYRKHNTIMNHKKCCMKCPYADDQHQAPTTPDPASKSASAFSVSAGAAAAVEVLAASQQGELLG